MVNNSQDAAWASFDRMSDEDQGLDLWGFLQRRKAFVILLAMVGAGLGYLYFQRQTPRYSSSALLQVIHHNSDPRMETLLAERNLSDAQFVITSNKLLIPCYEKHNLGQLETLRGLGPEDAVQKIAGMVKASPEAANILTLSCEGANPSDTAEIANAVATEFIEHQKESYEDALVKLQQLLTQAKDELSDTLRQTEQEYEEFDRTSPLLSDGSNVHRERLTQIMGKISDLVIKETEVKAQLQGLEEAARLGGNRQALLLLVGKESEGKAGETAETTDDAIAGAKSVAQVLFPLLLEEALLSEQVGADHPKLVTLRKQIEITRNHLDAMAGMVPEKRGSASSAPRPDFLAVYLDSLRQEIALLGRQKSELQVLANAEETSAKSLRAFEHQRSNFERRRQREESLLEDVQQQIRDTEMPTRMGGVTASVLSAAVHGSLVYPKLSQFLGMGAFLGGMVGLCLGYIIEVADRSFRKPEEIIREFGIPIVGHVPYMEERKLRKIAKDAVMDRTAITQHLPRSRPAEAYRTVRTAVCFSVTGNEHRVIQVTSPAAGDGKSTLALNFAISLAQSGKKTLLMESDFRRPKVHKLTGISGKLGVVDVLRGRAEIPDAIQQTAAEGLFAMGCGSRPKNPAELLTRPEYEHLLSALREEFEYIVVDTPPVLVVSDPCSVAPRVDGVLLCVRLSRHTRDFGKRSLEQLREVGAKMTGIVVNGVEEGDSYGYGTYNYSDYRYKYRYNDYNYGYNDKSSDSYYADHESEEPVKSGKG